MTDESELCPIDAHLLRQAASCLDALCTAGLTVVTAESCTAGLLAAVLSDAPGSAEHLQGGFITYTKESKCEVLGLPRELIDRHGVVSMEVAVALAEAGLAHSPADISVAVTGVAGPEPDDESNPVGLVYLACARRGHRTACSRQSFGDIGRGQVRYAAIDAALRLLDETARGRG